MNIFYIYIKIIRAAITNYQEYLLLDAWPPELTIY